MFMGIKAEMAYISLLGIGRDGAWRTCKFDYHKDKDPVATGTAKVIATCLKFRDVLEMKEYIDKYL